MIELFLEIPMELQVIILSCITMGVIQFIKDEKEKTKQKYESEKSIKAVSYTHLTLPTILRV